MRYSGRAMAIYLHETFEFNADTAEDYLSHIVSNDMLPIVEAGGTKPIGLFRTALRNTEGVFLWELKDWPPRPTWSTRARPGPMSSYLERRLPYRKDWTDRLLVAAPFSPTREQVLKRGYKNKLYMQVTAEVLPDKLDDFTSLIGKEGVPLSKKRGMELVGCFESAAGNVQGNEVIALWALDDWAHWGKVREARKSDKATGDYVRRGKAMLRRWSIKFLSPLPASPVQ